MLYPARQSGGAAAALVHLINSGYTGNGGPGWGVVTFGVMTFEVVAFGVMTASAVSFAVIAVTGADRSEHGAEDRD